MNQEEAKPVEIGDRMWLVEQRGRAMQGRPVMVSKIGSKWATLVNGERPAYPVGRFDKATGEYDQDGYGYRSRLYASREEHEAETALDEAWMAFNRLIRNGWSRPAHLTLSDVQTMTAMLEGKQP